ncbi:GvpL/GvpF family gas vesicle protein [Pseudonocardia asaccharolytica]|uniref:Gas vesicle protein n=1 Tax=Pseudonocardia asaccharolytica DSM 44247 = NBRC 16224 TaxID=1123024 RepID=A0A511D204_9PSEU|nr:GvpL/GvpF family gas vesicle protein [Pseudonocardia asaccharolytica]GEL17584.1 gas vesicle protein [Pseudonocardia asaccharolytica DSM 44247 = NBRC 16224]
MTPTYVYGLVAADTEIPEELPGLGPSGTISIITHGKLAAIVSDVPADRPLGTRDDLIAHETVLDSVAANAGVLPMRFPAVIEEQGVVAELLEPHHDHLVEVLAGLESRTQFTLKGRYEQDAVLREVLAEDAEVRGLQETVRALPEDAAYYDRVRLGELVVGALEERRRDDAEHMLERLRPTVVDAVAHQPANPDDVINAAFLVERARQREFEDAVEELGREQAERMRLRLLGPLAPYDFVPAE